MYIQIKKYIREHYIQCDDDSIDFDWLYNYKEHNRTIIKPIYSEKYSSFDFQTSYYSTNYYI